MAFHMILVLAACLFFSTCSASIFEDGSLGGDCANKACQLSLSGNFWNPIASNIATSLSSLTATSGTSMATTAASTIHAGLEDATPTLTLGSANATHEVAASSANVTHRVAASSATQGYQTPLTNPSLAHLTLSVCGAPENYTSSTGIAMSSPLQATGAPESPHSNLSTTYTFPHSTSPSSTSSIAQATQISGASRTIRRGEWYSTLLTLLGISLQHVSTLGVFSIRPCQTMVGSTAQASAPPLDTFTTTMTFTTTSTTTSTTILTYLAVR